MKRCGKCDTVKPAIEFYEDRKRAGALHTYCKPCCKEIAKARYAANPEDSKARHRDWVKANRDRIKAHKARSAYGLSAAEYEDLPAVCVICGSKERLVIDHSHQTGRVRGRLCQSCNKGLGFFRDNPTILYRAAEYILGRAKPDIFDATYEAA